MKIKFLLLVMLSAFIVLADQANANDTNSAPVGAIAGLSPVLSLTCTEVNFGVWRVPVRSSGGATTVTLTVSANNASGSTTATTGANTIDVALASGYEAPAAATCTVTGSNNASKTIQTAIADNTGLIFGSSTHNNLTRPVATAALTANLALAGAGVVINSAGSGTFRVVGVLSIPETIVQDNYGGYATSTAENAATVTVTDTADATNSSFF